MKRRKIGENEYINIQEIWEKPSISNKYRSEKRTRTRRTQCQEEMRDENLSTGIRLKNLRTIDVKPENKEVQLDMDWEERIRQRRKEIEDEENKREQRLQYKEIREQSWELNRLCRKYLEENDKDQREQERLENKKGTERLDQRKQDY